MLPNSLNELAHIVQDISRRELLPRFGCGTGSRKPDGSLVTDADLAVQDALLEALKDRWPDIAALSEEMDEAEQLRALEKQESGVWCIDPLDGTNNFSVGVPHYAVSVALIRNSRLEQAVVYGPSRDECFAAERGKGAFLNGEHLPRRGRPESIPLAQTVALVDLKRLPAELAKRLASTPPYKSQRNFGAVALDWCWVADGRCQLYLHGKQKLWDYAAGSLILEEAGGQALTLEGEPVFIPTLQPRSSAAALDREIFRQWIGWLEVPVAG